MATKACRQLAELAPRETSRALALLYRKRHDSSAHRWLLLRLELLVQQQGDSIAVACFLIEHLSALSAQPAEPSASAAGTGVGKVAAFLVGCCHSFHIILRAK